MAIIATLLLGLMLARLIWLDLKTRRLPDIYTLTLLGAGIVLNGACAGALPALSLWGAIFGYLSFWVVGEVFFRWRGREGLGLGDAKLLAATGAWLGLASLPMIVLISAATALGYSLLRGAPWDRAMPFGPFLAMSFWLLWLVQGPICA